MKWAYLSDQNAPPDAPDWMIRPQESRTANWTWEGRTRTLRDGRPEPFSSLAEFEAFVRELADHPDFALIYGRHHAHVFPAMVQGLEGDRLELRFTNLPDEPDAVHRHALANIHRALWTHQKPWAPIPRLYRHWLPVQEGKPLAILPEWIEPLQAAYQACAAKQSPESMEAQRTRFLEQYGVEQLRAALKSPTDTVTFFLGAQARSGLNYELEFGGLTKGFGEIRGGSSQKFVVMRTDDGFQKRGPSRKPISCSEDGAMALLQSIGTTLLNMAERLAEPNFISYWEVDSDSLPILHLGWVHKYLALTTNVLSFHHKKEHLRGHLLRLTGQPAPDNRWICDHLWRELFQRTPEFRDANPALLMQACFDVLPNLWDSAEEPAEEDSDLPIQSADNTPRNTILYGPPGTGKTYETALRAVQIIDGGFPKEEGEAETDFRRRLMTRYRELQRQWRIAFVTFHQSYSYEDFVEGIRPVMDDVAEAESSGPRYKVVDGILKEIALEAFGATLIPKSMPPGVVSFSTLWDALVDRIEASSDFTIPGLGDSEYALVVTALGNLSGTNIKGKAQEPYLASRTNVEKIWKGLPPSQKPSHNAVKAILGVGAHTNLLGAVIEALKEIQTSVPAPQVAPTVPTKQDVLACMKGDVNDSFARPENSDQDERFVLIVDEINRGNISKILGELITLLEDDKRLGSDNELTVTLPYSRESFGLPSNLYLVGTMNTADKSLALLDVALRRRFAFEELAPKFAVCGLEPLMEQALLELNRRITLRKDRDHRIGHAFFMGVGSDAEKFNVVFTAKVLPLLQEYFASDWEGLRFVLGESGDAEGFIVKLKGGDEKGARNKYQWYGDDGKTLDPLAQLLKNYGLTPGS